MPSPITSGGDDADAAGASVVGHADSLGRVPGSSPARADASSAEPCDCAGGVRGAGKTVAADVVAGCAGGVGSGVHDKSRSFVVVVILAVAGSAVAVPWERVVFRGGAAPSPAPLSLVDSDGGWSLQIASIIVK